jgi:hypothetical protein
LFLKISSHGKNQKSNHFSSDLGSMTAELMQWRWPAGAIMLDLGISLEIQDKTRSSFLLPP